MAALGFTTDLWRMKIEDHQCALDEYEALKVKTRFWGRVKRLAFSLIIISDKHRGTKNILRSTAARYAEKERQWSSPYWYIIHPFSTFRLFWMMVMTVIWLLSLFIIPYAYSFSFVGEGELADEAWRKGIFHAMLALNMFCMIDIGVNFFTGYYERSTKEIVLDQRRIFRKYFRSYFAIDLLSSNPYFNWMQANSEVQLFIGNWDDIGYMMLDTVKLLRIYSIVLNLSYLFKSVDLKPVFRQLVHLSVLFFQFIHWSACFTYLLPFLVHGKQVTDTSHELYYTLYQYCWLNLFSLPGQTRLMKYRFSFLRVLAHFATIGVCTTPTVFMIVDLLTRGLVVMMGFIFNAYLFGSVMHYSMQNAYANTKYYEILNQVDQFMFHRLFPMKLQRRLRRYYEYRFQHRFYREHNILQSLSDPIRREVALVCCRRLVENVSIFKELPRATIATIVSVLHWEIFLEDDVIVEAGSVGYCMYFLASGSVAVLLSSGKEICHLDDGAHFGEVSLLFESEKRIATVLALETCECYRLDGQDFKRILGENKALEHNVAKLALKRQKEAMLIDEQFQGESANINIGSKLK